MSNKELPPLPEPSFQLVWLGDRAVYKVTKPNIGDTDVYTADQMRDYYASAALAAQPVAQSTEAAAWKWGYEYLQSRMESIGRHGWAHDCDGEIEARIAAAPSPGASKPVQAEAPTRHLTREEDAVMREAVRASGELIHPGKLATPPAPCGAVEREAFVSAMERMYPSWSFVGDGCGGYHAHYTEAAWQAWKARARALLATQPLEQKPVAVLRFERGTPGRENDMPRVVSCDWLPDGEYRVYLGPQPEQVAQDREHAENYRWIRRGLPYTVKMKQATVIVGPSREKDYGTALDEAIRAARASGKGGGE